MIQTTMSLAQEKLLRSVSTIFHLFSSRQETIS